MGFLDSIERGLERAVNSAFARTFRSGVQPVEIAATLKKQLDIGSVIVDRDRVLTPNRFSVRVSAADVGRLQKHGATLEKELRSVVANYAAKQGYQMLGEPDVEIVEDPNLRAGVLEVDAESVEGRVNWNAVLEVSGVAHPLHTGTNVIGRGSDADVRLSDNGASRKHLEIDWDGKNALARDLGSTNGSKVNGQRFREATLAPETVITIGQTSLKFVLVPKRSTPSRQAKQPNAQRTTQLPSAGTEDFWSSL